MKIEEHVETLAEIECLEDDEAEKLAEEYKYPGELFTYLHDRDIFDDFSLPVDVDHGELFKEMGQAGVNYYTGKQVYKLETRGDPPDILSYSFPEPEKDTERFDYLGRAEDVVHYFRTDSSAVELERHRWNLDGDLEEKLGREHFWYMPVAKLRMYIDEYDWDELSEPEWSDLEEEYGFEPSQKDVEVDVEGTEQAGFDSFR